MKKEYSRLSAIIPPHTFDALIAYQIKMGYRSLSGAVSLALQVWEDDFRRNNDVKALLKK